jgi:hypothetical protein
MLMRLSAVLVTALVAAACGGGTKRNGPPPPAGPPLPEESEETADDDEFPVEVEEPPAPLEWSARAELAPVKGIKLKPATISFTQVEGEGTRVASVEPLVGLAAGKYHLVVHDSADCGKNAARIGGVWEPAAGAGLTVDVAKGKPAGVDVGGVELTLDGEDSIVRHTLVLHADKKGAPGKAVACGAIVAD